MGLTNPRTQTIHPMKGNPMKVNCSRAIVSSVVLAILVAILSAVAPTVAATPGPAPMVVVADGIACTNDNNDNMVALLQCTTALVNNELLEIGATPPQYALLQAGDVGFTQFDIGPSGPRVCGFVAGVLENLYCNGWVYFGEYALADLMRKTPAHPLLVAVWIALHETAHHLQEHQGGANLFSVFMTPGALPFERSADCIAGYLSAQMVNKGILDNQVRDLGGDFFASIGLEGDTIHGTPIVRKQDYFTGFDEGVTACGPVSEGLYDHAHG